MPTPTAPAAVQRVALDVHPLALNAARLIVGHEADVASLIARRDALPQTDPWRSVLTLDIEQLRGWIAQLAPYLPTGWSAAAVLTAGCTSCGAGPGQAHGRGRQERYGEEFDHH